MSYEFYKIANIVEVTIHGIKQRTSALITAVYALA